MEINLKRTHFTDKSTIGILTIEDNSFTCFILEDKDRGLDASMTLEEINKLKVFGATCIPYGRYQIIVTKSERFTQLRGVDTYLPLLLNIKGFDGVRCHTGNKPEDTEGCLLPGTTIGLDAVYGSTPKWTELNNLINNTLKKGEIVFINITKDA